MIFNDNDSEPVIRVTFLHTSTQTLTTFVSLVEQTFLALGCQNWNHNH